MDHRGAFLCFSLCLWISNVGAAGEIPWAHRKGPANGADNGRFLQSTAKGSSFNPSFNVERTIAAVTESFRRVFSQHFDGSTISETAYESQCTVDFQKLFNTTDYNNPAHPTKGLLAIDALGKPGSNILNGNTHFVGSFDECLDIGEGLTKYCTIYLKIYNNTLNVSMDICIPPSCNGTDVYYLVATANALDPDLSIVPYYNAGLCETKSIPYSTGAIVMIVVCGIFLSLVFFGSFIDIVIQSVRCLISKPEFASFVKYKQKYVTERSPLLGSACQDTASRDDIFSSFEKPLEFITAFSVFKNVPIILSTKQPPTAITSLNGIRVISMFWVILGHTYYWALLEQKFTNPLYVGTHVVKLFSMQAITNAFFSVDSFFFLSGTLVSYLTLREMDRRKGIFRFPVLTYYIHRYLRLTMVYAFLLFFWWFLTVHFGNGSGWMNGLGEESTAYTNCEKYWWTNLLYINNFYPWKLENECMGWTWYLANDMQFYVLAPLVLIPLYYFFPVGLAISGLMLIGTMATTGAIAGVKKFSANVLLEANQDESNDIYIKPYSRAAPYIVGLILGFLLFKKIRINFHWFLDFVIHIWMWIVAAGCCFSVVYGLYDSFNGHHLSMAENVSYYMFSRLAWGVGLALIVFVCHNGYGWVINDFLSMKIWIPLSRLTYTAYLIHPIVLTIIFGTLREPFTYSNYIMAVYAVAMVVLSFGAAGVVAVFVEFPLSNLEMAVFKAIGLKLRESTRHAGDERVRRVETPPSSSPINEDNK